MIVQDGIIMQHLCVDGCLLGKKPNEVSKMSVRDILIIEYNVLSWEQCLLVAC